MSKEKFEDRKLHGDINIACKFDDGTVRYWQTTKQEVVRHIVQIVNEYQEDGYVLTLRQLHYQLVTNNWIVNHDSAYSKLGNILDDCRYSGIIDWDAIEDRGRIPHLLYHVKDIADALNDTVNQYRLDRQLGQQHNIELWTEKDALSGILKRSTEKYHVRLVVNKGYTSSSAIYNSYLRIIEALKKKQFTTILYFGDHDPSGLDMIRDIRDRLSLMLKNGRYEIDPPSDIFEVIQIGLTMSQIKQYNLPPNPTKLTDSRAKKYISKFGKTCWEVDALKPQTLTQIVESNILSVLQKTKFDKVVKRENKEIVELKKLVNQYNNS